MKSSRRDGSRKRAGYSELEFLVTAATTSILLAGLYSFYRTQVFVVRTEEVVINLKEEVDVATDFLVKELRVAGARPESWPAGGCGGTATKPAACPSFERITTAGADRITVQYDYRGAAATDPADGCPIQQSEQVTYFYHTTSREVRRQTLAGTGAVVHDVPSGGFVLRYFDRNGNALTPDVATGLLTEADRRSVAVIEFLVSAVKAHPSPDNDTDLSFSRSSQIFLRNEGHC